MKYYKILTIILVLTVTFLVSCGYTNEGAYLFSSQVEAPPFVITKPVCETRERSGYFRYAGIVFNFMNTENKVIDEVTVSFSLYDSATNENPFIGSNRFEITKMNLLLPNENKEVIISLDQYIYYAPLTPYLIDFFYISRIHFTDGSIWEDIYGLYKIY